MVSFRLKTVLAGAALSSLTLGSAANAAQFLYTITGVTTNDVIDLYGYEGATLPVGEAFTLSFLIDDALPTAQYDYGVNQSYAKGGGQYSTVTRPPVTATFQSGSFNYTIRTGDLLQPYGIDGVGDPTGEFIQELDLGSVNKDLAAGELTFSSRFDRHNVCCGIFYGYSGNSIDQLDLSLFSPDFKSIDYRETGTFDLAPGSIGSFLTGYIGQDRSSTTVYYESAGLSATQLTVAAVPEPQNWAIMLFGAGFIGMSLRARRMREVMRPARQIANI